MGKLPRGSEIERLVKLVVDAESTSTNPVDFDFEKTLREVGCDPELAGIIADMMPEAFGFVVLREMKLRTVDRADFRFANGSIRLAPLSSDPVWRAIGRVAETMARDSSTRAAFSRVAQGSACIAALNEALNAGQTPTTCAVAFARPPRRWSLLDRLL